MNEKKIKKESQRPWDNIKCTNIHIIWFPEGEEKEKVPDKIFDEIIAKHFLNRNGMDLVVAEDIRKRWQEYAEELHKKDLHEPDNHD